MFLGNKREIVMTQQVLVTGGTQGIGRAIAEAFAAAGYQVLATGIEADLPTDPSAETTLRFAHLDICNLSKSGRSSHNLIASMCWSIVLGRSCVMAKTSRSTDLSKSSLST